MHEYVICINEMTNLKKGAIYLVIGRKDKCLIIRNDIGMKEAIIVDNINFKYLLM